MIERIQSRTAKPILKSGGRFLCSSVDPVKEAAAWVEKNKFRLIGQKKVIALGIGCGYHLVALQKVYPSLEITAIDARKEVIDFVKREHPIELSRAHLMLASDLKQFRENPKIHKIICSHYGVLKFPPALVTNDLLYKQIEDLLIGRTEAGFQFLLSHRGDLRQIFGFEKVREVTGGLISIKTLESAMPLSSEHPNGCLFKALRELVN